MNMRCAWITLGLALALGTSTPADAAAKSRKAAPVRAATPAKPPVKAPATAPAAKPVPTKPTPAPTPATTPAPTGTSRTPPPTSASTPGPTTPPTGADSPTEGNGEITRYQFTGLDIEGELRTPALLQFLSRIGGEFETVGIPHRSFMPELSQTVTEDAL